MHYQSLFQEKDYLDSRYFHKRSFYLAVVAQSLSTTFEVDTLYHAAMGDPRLTMLVLLPRKGMLSGTSTTLTLFSSFQVAIAIFRNPMPKFTLFPPSLHPIPYPYHVSLHPMSMFVFLENLQMIFGLRLSTTPTFFSLRTPSFHYFLLTHSRTLHPPSLTLTRFFVSGQTREGTEKGSCV